VHLVHEGPNPWVVPNIEQGGDGRLARSPAGDNGFERPEVPVADGNPGTERSQDLRCRSPIPWALR
jgi:hypothetical protein